MRLNRYRRVNPAAIKTAKNTTVESRRFKAVLAAHHGRINRNALATS